MSEHETTPYPTNPTMAPAPPATVAQDDSARRERAFTLYCEGWRTTRIALAFDMDAQTIQEWIATSLRALVNELPHDRASQLARAIASQRMLAAAAWAGYAREREIERQNLADDFDDERTPRHTSHAHRYLSLALAIEREIARLQGLYAPGAPAPAQVRIVLERLPDGPDNPTSAATSNEITDDQPPALLE